MKTFDTSANECIHDVPYDEHCDWCDGDDECDPPPSLGYVDRTDGDEMPPLLDEPSGPGWLGALLLGALAAAAVAVVWGCR
ncbi:MAG: hypothetical protein EKK55_08820 [Rhodocyclaceae bacterium]|nr:MAG: hypothetical protein EKK55_08820 [Rhodocyclaceae bacterium]